VLQEEVKAQFKVLSGNLDQEEFTVGRQGIRMGRDTDNNLVLRHREISRQHLLISWRIDDKYQVEDLNSSNGVWLNEVRIPPRLPQELTEGDAIRCGPFSFRFVGLILEAPTPPPFVPAPSGVPLLPVNGKYMRLPIPGVPQMQSTWLQYLPAIYAQDEFLGRYLLIFESLLSPVTWAIDNFDLYLSPEVAPQAWLEWIASWFDLLLLPELPIERQREIIRQAGWLFLRRGTRAGLQRLLELYFGVIPEIIENDACRFVVRLPLSQSSVKLGRDVADRLIQSQKPAFAAYSLEIT
jgi:phage tail-like protein